MFDGTMSSILNVLHYMCFHEPRQSTVEVQESGSCRGVHKASNILKGDIGLLEFHA